MTISLTLQADGQFAWEVDSKGQKQTLTGQSGFKDGTLALLQAEGPPLVGKVSDEAAGKFVFTPPAPEARRPALPSRSHEAADLNARRGSRVIGRGGVPIHPAPPFSFTSSRSLRHSQNDFARCPRSSGSSGSSEAKVDDFSGTPLKKMSHNPDNLP